MKLISNVVETLDEIRKTKEAGRSIGFVPTMGALHEGHLSLIRRAREENDYVVVSIFVNPIQFCPGEDYESYPRDLKRDSELCENEGVDLVFAPAVEEMYPEGFCTYVDQKGLTEVLCGARRPGHFSGVLTVVSKLFNILQPDRAYFGAKDYQQSLIIRRMVRDLNMMVDIVVCPTVRERDGLAMSSRNWYLSPEERRQASCLYRALMRAKELAQDGERDPARIIEELRRVIEGSPDARIDYIEVVHPETLRPIERVEQEALVALAVRFGKARLIDNCVIEVKK